MGQYQQKLQQTDPLSKQKRKEIREHKEVKKLISKEMEKYLLRLLENKEDSNEA